MTKLSKKPHMYGSEFTAIEELDNAMDTMEQIITAKIDAISDILAGAIKRIDELEKKTKPKPRKKIQKDGNTSGQEAGGT